MLGDGSEQFVVSSDDFGLAPGGIQVSAPDFARLRSELQSGRRGLGHWNPAIVEVVDLRIRPIDVDPVAVVILAAAIRVENRVGAFDPARQRASASPLVALALKGEPLESALLELIGAGPGSTPAGDDVVVGVLAGLQATGRDAVAANIAGALPDLLARTTSASRMYLSAAADGRFAERVHQLVRGLDDRSSAYASARSAGRWGATSGFDLLSGVLAGASAPAQIRWTA